MTNPWKLTTLGLASILAFMLAGGGSVAAVDADKQPKMHQALEHLRSAKNALEAATADKGGHRVKAIALTKQAIDEVQAGIKFDNKH